MKRHAVLVIAGTGLLFFCSGCSALILGMASRGDNTPYQIAIGSARDDVEAQLGNPVTVTPLPDGGQVAIYEHRLPAPGARSAAEFAVKMYLPGCGAGGCSPLGLGPVLEPFVFPYAVYKATTAPTGKIAFTYSPDGRLLHRDLPPPYGAEEAALGPPTVEDIQQRCRSQGDVEQSESLASDHGREVTHQYGYVECITRGFAIWGIE